MALGAMAKVSQQPTIHTGEVGRRRAAPRRGLLAVGMLSGACPRGVPERASQSGGKEAAARPAGAGLRVRGYSRIWF